MHQFARHLRWLAPLALLLGVTAALAQSTPAPKADGKTATAIFAAGCFWCVEEAFEKVPGVSAAVSGYIGGKTANPTYEQVVSGTTGHTEAVQVTYDPGKVRYEQLVDWFWKNVDPLDADGQFCDKGSQYRSGIFYQGEAQKKAAEASKAGAGGLGTLQATDRHGDHRRRAVLFGGGLPPGLLQEKRQPLSVLQVRLPARAAAGAAVGQGHAAAEQLMRCSLSPYFMGSEGRRLAPPVEFVAAPHPRNPRNKSEGRQVEGRPRPSPRLRGEGEARAQNPQVLAAGISFALHYVCRRRMTRAAGCALVMLPRRWEAR